MLMNNGFNTEKMNNIKNLVDSGNLNEAISQISPEMIENFSKMMNNSNNMNSSNNINSNSSNTYKNKSSQLDENITNNNANSSTNNNNANNTTSQSNSKNNFDFSSIDMNTVMKMKSVMDNMNSKNDPRSNLLNSLKPYLRDTKKEKIDQYVNLLYFSKVAEMFNNSNNNKGD